MRPGACRARSFSPRPCRSACLGLLFSRNHLRRRAFRLDRQLRAQGDRDRLARARPGPGSGHRHRPPDSFREHRGQGGPDRIERGASLAEIRIADRYRDGQRRRAAMTQLRAEAGSRARQGAEPDRAARRGIRSRRAPAWASCAASCSRCSTQAAVAGETARARRARRSARSEETGRARAARATRP